MTVPLAVRTIQNCQFPVEAEQAAATPSDVSEADAVGPRRLYNRWPRHAFTDAGTLMRQAAEPQLPRLAAALGSISGAGG